MSADSFTTRMPADVRRAAKLAAARAGVSLNEWLVDLARAAAHLSEIAALDSEIRHLSFSAPFLCDDEVEARTDLISVATRGTSRPDRWATP